jgi:parallel beta-helix repeat protein
MKNHPSCLFFFLTVISFLSGCHLIHYFDNLEYNHPDGLFVSISRGSDSNSGTMEKPFLSIQKAIDTASSSGSKKNVYVEEGTYTVNNYGLAHQGSSSCYGVYASSSAYNNISVSGGWISMGKYYYCRQTGTTILDSENHTPESNGFDLTGSSGDRLTNYNIDKFTIINGNTNYGSGIYISYSSNCTISNCIIKDNTGVYNGGGIYVSYSDNITIRNCSIIANKLTYSSNKGGGIAIDYNSDDCIIDNCTFYDNSSEYGTCIYIDNSINTVITKCRMESNTCSINGAGIYTTGSSITNIKITGNNFVNNIGFGDVYFGSYSAGNLDIKNNKFNRSGAGTAIYFNYIDWTNIQDYYTFINNEFKSGYTSFYHLYDSSSDLIQQSDLNDSSKTNANAGSYGNIVK